MPSTGVPLPGFHHPAHEEDAAGGNFSDQKQERTVGLELGDERFAVWPAVALTRVGDSVRLINKLKTRCGNGSQGLAGMVSFVAGHDLDRHQWASDLGDGGADCCDGRRGIAYAGAECPATAQRHTAPRENRPDHSQTQHRLVADATARHGCHTRLRGDCRVVSATPKRVL